MEWIMEAARWLGMVLFFLIMVLALLSIIFGLPGLWVIVAESILFALLTRFDKGIGWWDLIALTALAGAAELLEFLITAYGAKKFGASTPAAIAALIGGIIGALFLNTLLPIIGALLGAFAGVFLGAFLYTYMKEKDADAARQAGLGALMGRMGAVLAKGTIGAAMAAIIITQIAPFL